MSRKEIFLHKFVYFAYSVVKTNIKEAIVTLEFLILVTKMSKSISSSSNRKLLWVSKCFANPLLLTSVACTSSVERKQWGDRGIKEIDPNSLTRFLPASFLLKVLFNKSLLSLLCIFFDDFVLCYSFFSLFAKTERNQV